MQIYKYKEIEDINEDCLMLLKLILRYSLEKDFYSKNHNSNVIFKKIKQKIKYIPKKKILDGIVRHRISTILYQEKEILSLIPNLERDIEIISNIEKREAMKIVGITKEIAALFEMKNIPMLIIKGAPLSIQTTGNLFMRGCGDLDAFVDINNLFDAIEILKNNQFLIAGYHTAIESNIFYRNYQKFVNSEITLYRKKSQYIEFIDLHWRVSQIRGLLPEFKSLWDNKEVIYINSQKVFTLSKKDAFLHSCLHAENDNWMCLRNILDISRLAMHTSIDVNSGNNKKIIEKSLLIAFDIFPSKSLFCFRLKRPIWKVKRILKRAKTFQVLQWGKFNTKKNFIINILYIIYLQVFSISNNLENLISHFLNLMIPPNVLINPLNGKLLNPFEIIEKRYLRIKKRLNSKHDIS